MNAWVCMDTSIHNDVLVLFLIKSSLISKTIVRWDHIIWDLKTESTHAINWNSLIQKLLQALFERKFYPPASINTPLDEGSM